MTIETYATTQIWKQQWFVWLTLGIGLSIIYFTLIWRADDTGQLSMSLLFYCCVFSSLKDRYRNITFNRDWISYLIGLMLIGWILLSSSPQTDDYTVRLFPFIAGVAIALLASGWQQLKQHWKELTILFFLGVPSFLAYHLVDISPLTAKFSTLMLWYTGFDIVSQGTFMALADGRVVQVVYDCSGIDMVNYLLGMSVICLIMFPIPGWFNQLFVPSIGAFTGFFVNGIRVALMVVLAKFDQKAFDNWHTGTGSYTFAVLGIALLGLFYWFLISKSESPRSSEKNIDPLT